jgi:hypothetical protein
MNKHTNLVTILTSSLPQKKMWYRNENSEYELLDKQFSKFYTFNEVAIADVNDLHTLVQAYAFKGNSCFIRGKITEHGYNRKLSGYKIRRLVKEKVENNILERPTIKDYPKNWLMLDIDNFPTPVNISLNLKSHRENAVESFIQTLHESFHDTTYVCQFSNGMFLNSNKIKAHLWFMLNESYSGEVLKPWFEKYCEGVDKCVFRPAQILYTANPSFANVGDPLGKSRIYIKEKKLNKVSLPKKRIFEEYLKE